MWSTAYRKGLQVMIEAVLSTWGSNVRVGDWSMGQRIKRYRHTSIGTWKSTSSDASYALCLCSQVFGHNYDNEWNTSALTRGFERDA